VAVSAGAGVGVGVGSTGASIFSTRTEGRTLAMYLRSWLWRVSGSVMPRTEIVSMCSRDH
jgi:hypothetical protein